MSVENPQLQSFSDRLPVLLDRLRDLGLPEDFDFDFSPVSVTALEQVVVGQGPERADVLAAGAYLGEVLLRVAGGGWRWGETDGPVLAPDPALGLDPVAVTRVVAAALSGEGGAMTAVVARAEQAVQRRRQAEPGWSPQAEQRPAHHDVRVADLPRPPWLTAWLTERATGFDVWAEEHGGRAGWDFSLSSLDRLEGVLLAGFDSPEAVSAAVGRPDLEGAVWYLGEVLCRAADARWHYFEPDPANPPTAFAGKPHVTQDHPDGASVVPLGLLRAAVRVGRPGELRRRAEAFG